MEPLNGVCCVMWETGYEGPPWAFQDSVFIFPPSEEWPHEQWSYDGLHVLEDGDHLTIYAKGTPRLIVWEGVIDLRAQEELAPMQHGIQRQRWIHWFLNGHPATLVLGPKHQEEEHE